MTKVYLGLGSNLGCKAGNIRRAVNLLKSESRIHNVELSSCYRTDPLGEIEQDWFVNAVAALETSLPARELLDLCLSIERQLKRVRAVRWGPRTLDLDILFFGEEAFHEDGLEVPHPRICERAFVLGPLLELCPDRVLKGRPLSQRLQALPGQGLERLEPVVTVLGASGKPERFANRAQRGLMAAGYRVVPVAAKGETVLEQPVVRDLRDCIYPVDTLTLYVASARLPGLLESILEACPARVIFNPGTENREVLDELKKAGIEALEACTLAMLREGRF